MKEEQQRDRDWDERMAREVLPAKILELKKLKQEHQKMKEELEDRRLQDSLQITQLVSFKEKEESKLDAVPQSQPTKELGFCEQESDDQIPDKGPIQDQEFSFQQRVDDTDTDHSFPQ
jgi:hypothetical protein